MTATLPHPTQDLDHAGDAFTADTVVDHEAADNSGLIPAVAALLMDLHRRRQVHQALQDVDTIEFL
jgi:hypothetical protein